MCIKIIANSDVKGPYSPEHSNDNALKIYIPSQYKNTYLSFFEKIAKYPNNIVIIVKNT